jgi:folate-binding protein YgfZ
VDPEINWKAFVAARGGSMNGDAVEGFGVAVDELAAARDSAALVPLAHLGILTVAGQDAAAFLQNQVTSDVGRVSPNAAQLSGYCTPKGRLVATFLLLLQNDAYRLVLPRAMAAPLEARLRRYVLRSKVSISDTTRDFALLGVCGPGAYAAVSQVFPSAPRQPLEAAQYPQATVAALPGDCFLLLADSSQVDYLWSGLSALARPAGAAAWNWRQVRAGVAGIFPSTQEAFLPQMLGLESYGAVSFQKGCYPGQEIVARTHYLGDLKRRLVRLFAGNAAQPGDSVLGDGDQVVGTVAMAGPSPDGGWEMLAVVQRDVLPDGKLRLADGTPLHPALVLSAGNAHVDP